MSDVLNDQWSNITADPRWEQIKAERPAYAQRIVRVFAQTIANKYGVSGSSPEMRQFLQDNLSSTPSTQLNVLDRAANALPYMDEDAENIGEGNRNTLTGSLLSDELPDLTAVPQGLVGMARDTRDTLGNVASDLAHGNVTGMGSGAKAMAENMLGQMADPAGILLGYGAGKLASLPLTAAAESVARVAPRAASVMRAVEPAVTGAVGNAAVGAAVPFAQGRTPTMADLTTPMLLGALPGALAGMGQRGVRPGMRAPEAPPEAGTSEAPPSAGPDGGPSSGFTPPEPEEGPRMSYEDFQSSKGQSQSAPPPPEPDSSASGSGSARSGRRPRWNGDINQPPPDGASQEDWSDWRQAYDDYQAWTTERAQREAEYQRQNEEYARKTQEWAEQARQQAEARQQAKDAQAAETARQQAAEQARQAEEAAQATPDPEEAPGSAGASNFDFAARKAEVQRFIDQNPSMEALFKKALSKSNNDISKSEAALLANSKYGQKFIDIARMKNLTNQGATFNSWIQDEADQGLITKHYSTLKKAIHTAESSKLRLEQLPDELASWKTIMAKLVKGEEASATPEGALGAPLLEAGGRVARKLGKAAREAYAEATQHVAAHYAKHLKILAQGAGPDAAQPLAGLVAGEHGSFDHIELARQAVQQVKDLHDKFRRVKAAADGVRQHDAPIIEAFKSAQAQRDAAEAAFKRDRSTPNREALAAAESGAHAAYQAFEPHAKAVIEAIRRAEEAEGFKTSDLPRSVGLAYSALQPGVEANHPEALALHAKLGKIVNGGALGAAGVPVRGGAYRDIVNQLAPKYDLAGQQFKQIQDPGLATRQDERAQARQGEALQNGNNYTDPADVRVKGHAITSEPPMAGTTYTPKGARPGAIVNPVDAAIRAGQAAVHGTKQAARAVLDGVVRMLDHYEGTPVYHALAHVYKLANDAFLLGANKTARLISSTVLGRALTDLARRIGPDNPVLNTLGRFFISDYGVPPEIRARWHDDIGPEVHGEAGRLRELAKDLLDRYQRGDIDIHRLNDLGREVGDPRSPGPRSPEGESIAQMINHFRHESNFVGALSDESLQNHMAGYLPRIYRDKPAMAGLFRAIDKVMHGYYRRGTGKTMSVRDWQTLSQDWVESPYGPANARGKYTHVYNAQGQMRVVAKDKAGDYLGHWEFERFTGPHAEKLGQLESKIIPGLERDLLVARHGNQPTDRLQERLDDAKHLFLDLLEDPQTKIKAHRDYTLAESAGMGQDHNIIAGLMKFADQWEHDMRSGKFLKELADDPSISQQAPMPAPGKPVPDKPGYTYFGYDQTKGKNVLRWGKLAGHYVRDDVASFLKLNFDHTGFLSKVKKYTGVNLAKKVNTLYNQNYFLNNFMVNVPSLVMRGGNINDIFRALQDSRDKSPLFVQAVRRGIIRQHTLTTELGLAYDRAFPSYGPGGMWQALKDLPGKFEHSAADFAAATDDVFRLALLRSRLAHGESFEQAARAALDGFYDPRKVTAPAVHILEAFWTMFPKPMWYTASLFLQTLADNPLALLLLGAGVWTLNKTAAAMAGVKDDDGLQALLRPHLQGFGNKLMLPTRDKFNRPQLIGTQAWNPVQSAYADDSAGLQVDVPFTRGMGDNGAPVRLGLPKGLMPSNPLISLGVVAMGRNPSNGHRFVDDVDNTAAQYLAQSYIPKALQKDLPRLYDALLGRESANHMTYTPEQALGNFVGLTTQPLDIPVEASRMANRMKAQEAAIGTKMSSVRIQAQADPKNITSYMPEMLRLQKQLQDIKGQHMQAKQAAIPHLLEAVNDRASARLLGAK